MPERVRSLPSTKVTRSLNIKLRSLYSTPVQVTMPSVQTGTFRVWRGYEGLQIVINWPTPQSGVDQIKIMRKLFDWPSSVTDGVCLVTESYPFSLNSYSDRELTAYQVYYYVMFLHRLDGTWYTDRHLRGKTFPLPTGYFELGLWDRLPGVYHVQDGES